MCILLCFCNTKLCLAALTQVFTQCHVQIFRRICNGNVRHGSIILSHANELYRKITILSLETVEIWIYEATCQLSCTVRTEVEEYHAVPCLNSAVLFQNGRQHEFVGNIVSIAVLDCLYRISGGLYTFAQNHCIICLFYTIPCIVTIHCIITTRNGGNFTNADFIQLGNCFLHETSGRCRRFVTAVQKCVYIYLGQTFPLCHFQQSVQVRNVAVHAARREQTHQVQSSSLFFASIHCCGNCRIFEELAVLNILCNLYQHLINDSAGTDVGVTNFRVAHLTVRKTNVQPAGTDQGIRALHIFVQIWLLCCVDCIAVITGIMTKAVHDN